MTYNCQSCKDTGKYVGLNIVEDCPDCKGKRTVTIKRRLTPKEMQEAFAQAAKGLTATKVEDSCQPPISRRKA